MQQGATRLSLPDGVCRIYFVLDVASRVVLASRVVRSLSMHLAKLTLDEAIAVLRAQGCHEAILVQQGGGSDFTSDLFQQRCLKYGSWVRCKVSQSGGTGILERLKRTCKYQFAFRQDWQSMADVRAAMPDFHRWYNHERRHSAPLLRHALVYTHLIGERSQRRLKSNLEHYREICGFGDIPHWLLMRANIFPVGEPGRQNMQLEETIRNHSAGDVLNDEVQPSDIELLMTTYTNGTNVICSLHGKSIRSSIRNLERRIMLGLVENPRDGISSQTNESIFTTIIEVHAKGLMQVITAVDAAVEAVMTGQPIDCTCDYTCFGP